MDKSYNVFKTFYYKEVNRRSLSSSVVFFTFSGRYFVKYKNYFTLTFAGILSGGLFDPWL